MNALQNITNKLSMVHEMAEGKEKGELKSLLNGEVVTITEFDFVQMSNDGVETDVAIFVTKEHENNYFYGGSVVTETLKKLEKVLNVDAEATKEFKSNGLPASFTSVESQNDKTRKYTVVEFFTN